MSLFAARPARKPGRRPTWSTPAVARVEVLAGLVVALALIPEALSFAVVAHVDPRVGLFSSVTMAVTISIVGGRPAMVSGAAGSVALVVAPLTRSHGVSYLVAAVVLGGLFQVGFGLLGAARLVRFLPRAVMIGFVDALAILIFSAQLPNLEHVGRAVYVLTAAGLALIVVVPRVSRAVPAPLVAVVVLTVVTVVGGIEVPTVASKGALPDGFPRPGLPAVPFDLHTLAVIAPYSLALALVGLLESLLTAQLVDDITGTGSDMTRESWGQGVANIVTGLFGGMGGCGMIGQTMINVRTGRARTRLSTFTAGIAILVLALAVPKVLGAIPMAALVAVMVLVAVKTFDWQSIRPATLRRLPRGETAVTAVVVAVVVATQDLAIGVVLGFLAAAVVFLRQVARAVDVSSRLSPDGQVRTYTVHGNLFFASSNGLGGRFDPAGDPGQVVIDLSGAHLWDASSVAELDAVVLRYAARSKSAVVVGLAGHGADLHRDLSGHLGVSTD